MNYASNMVIQHATYKCPTIIRCQVIYKAWYLDIHN